MRPLRALIHHVAARWPALGGAAADAAREEERRRLAAFLVEPGAATALAPSPGARGFAGTPGIGAAVAAQRLMLAAAAAEAAARAHDQAGAAAAAATDRAAARAHHAEAAALLCRAVAEIPDVEDDTSDRTRQFRLARALALMLLARAAFLAGLAERRWGRLGKAEGIARDAVALQPLIPYLRSQQAELLCRSGRHADAVAALADARPLAASLAERMKLADQAGEIAAGSGDAALLAAAEERFIAPLLGSGRDDGPDDPPEDDAEAAAWAWVLAFRGGRLDVERARLAGPGEEGSLGLARRAARRFARALALVPAGRDPAREAEDRRSLANWLRDAHEAAARLALARGDAAAAALTLAHSPSASSPDGDRAGIALALAAAVAEGRRGRFAATALLTPDAWSLGARLALDGLAGLTAPRLDAASVAVPWPPDALVVEVSDPLLIEEALARRIIGGEEAPSIAGLRHRLRERHGFTLPGVRLRGLADPGLPGRIAVLERGSETEALVVPEAAALALAHPGEAAAAGLAVLRGPAVTIGGLACAWVPRDARAGGIVVLPPAYALLGLLEAAALRAMPRLAGLDEAAEAFAVLAEERLDAALAVLRHLLAERMPLGHREVRAAASGWVHAGEAPAAVMARLRALPGVIPLLWGNEPGRRAVALPASLEGALARAEPPAGALEDLDTLLGGIEAPVLVVAAASRRAAVRARVARRHPDLPVLAAAERTGRR